jgi:GAF domain-containing protein
MSLTARLFSIFRLKYNYTDSFERLRARGLWRITWSVLFIWLGLIAYVTVSSTNPARTPVYVVILAVGALVAVGILVLINRGASITASLVFIIQLFVTVALVYTLATTNLLLSAFSLPIIAAGVLLNRRGMLVMVALTVVDLAITAVLGELGALPPQTTTTAFTLSTLIISILIVCIDGLFLIVFAGGQRAMVRRNINLAAELRSSAAISQAIASIHTVDELLNQTITLIRDRLEYYHVHIYLVEEQTKLLVLRAGTAFGSDEMPLQQRRIAPDDPGIINRTARMHEAQLVTTSDPAVRRTDMLPGMQAQLVVPIKRGDQVLGVLDIQDIEADTFNTEDMEVLEGIAAQLVIAVENAQRFSDLQQVSSERERLADELRRAGQEIEQLNREVTERVWSRYLAGRGETAIGYDWKQGTLYPNTQAYPSLERAFNSRQPELFTENDEHILSVPIISRGQMLGAMEFRAPASRTWNKRSLELARVISQRLALALDNVRLFEQAQIVATREQLANQIAANLQTKTDVDALVAVAAETFQQALGATRTNIRLGFPDEEPAQTNGRNGSH